MSGADASTEIDEDVVESIELVGHRAEFLEHLRGQQRYQNELVDELGLSRPTVHRAIRSLENQGFVRRLEGGYQTTALGDLALERFRQFLSEQEAVLDASGVLTTLPDEPPLPIDLCVDGDAELVSSPYQLFESLAAGARKADRCRAVFPAAVGARQLRLCHSLAVDGDCDVEVLLKREQLRRFGRDYHTLCSELVDEGALRSITESPPFALLVTSTHRQEFDDGTVHVVTYDENGDGVGILRAADETTREWAQSYYRQYRTESWDAHQDVQAVDPIGISPVFSGDRLPLSLRSEGFVQRDGTDAECHEPMPPATAWQAGLGFDEVQAGYALPRRYRDKDDTGSDRSAPDSQAEWLTAQLCSQLQADSPVALLGPPGCGKSTVCKRVACVWPERTGGTVLYRESGCSDPFTSTTTLRQVVEQQQRTGPVLVVVEDAVRREANAIFEVIDALQHSDDVAVLLDARESEWTDPEEFPIDARLKAIRQEIVDVTHVPRLTERECRRLFEHVEDITDREPSVSPADMLADTHQTTHETIGDDQQAIAGELFVLFHRLGRTLDPLSESDASTDRATVLNEHVDRVRTALEEAGETALEVGILANVCNAAGFRLDPAYLYTPVLDGDATESDVRGALSILEDEMLFDGPGTEYRGIHESWSVTFLDRLGAEHHGADELFGRVLTRLLSLATESGHRSALVRRMDETPALDRLTVEPVDWMTDTVSSLYELGRTRPKLAGLYEHKGTGSVNLPRACPEGIEADAMVWLGRMLLNAGEYERAVGTVELALEEVADTSDQEDDSLRLRCRLLAVKASAQQELSAHESAETAARRLCVLAGRIDDTGLEARGRLVLGNVARDRGDYDDARSNYRDALAAYEARADRHGVATAHNRLGRLDWLQHRYERACDHHERALEDFQAIGNRLDAAEARNNLGTAALKRGDLDDAREHYERALYVSQSIGAAHNVAKAHGNLGLVAQKVGANERAYEAYQQALSQFEAIGDKDAAANARNNLSIVAKTLGAYEEAHSFATAALERFEALENPRLIAEATNQLGAIHKAAWADGEPLEEGSDQRARELFLDALSHAKAAGNRHIRADVEYELAGLERSCGAFEAASTRLESALSGYEAVGDDRGAAMAHFESGLVALATEDWASAREEFDIATRRFEQVGATRLQARAEHALGFVAAVTDDLDAARTNWERVRTLFNTAADEADERQCWRTTPERIQSESALRAGLHAIATFVTTALADGTDATAAKWWTRGWTVVSEIEWDGTDELETRYREIRRQLPDDLDVDVEPDPGGPPDVEGTGRRSETSE